MDRFRPIETAMHVGKKETPDLEVDDKTECCQIPATNDRFCTHFLNAYGCRLHHIAAFILAEQSFPYFHFPSTLEARDFPFS